MVHQRCEEFFAAHFLKKRKIDGNVFFNWRDESESVKEEKGYLNFCEEFFAEVLLN